MEKFRQSNNLIHNTFESYEAFLKRVEEVWDGSDYEVNSDPFVRDIFGNQQFNYTEAVIAINKAISKIKKRRKEEAQKKEGNMIKNQDWISESARRQELREKQREKGRLPNGMEEYNPHEED